jgi:cytosine/uracil/thiamine/allantoin permease
VIEEAEHWIVHLGNVAAPLSGVVLADYVARKRTMIDVPALFEPGGRYRYLAGVNAAALAAVAAGVGVYYAVPHTWLKVLWGIAAAGSAYLVLAATSPISHEEGAGIDESLELPERARERAFGQS